MTVEKITITVFPEWWLQIISNEVTSGMARGWDPPERFKRFWVDVLFPIGMRMSPSEHTIRRARRVSNA